MDSYLRAIKSYYGLTNPILIVMIDEDYYFIVLIYIKIMSLFIILFFNHLYTNI